MVDGHRGVMLLLLHKVELLLRRQAVLHLHGLVMVVLLLLLLLMLHKKVLVQPRLLRLMKDGAWRELHPRVRPPQALSMDGCAVIICLAWIKLQ